MRLLPADKRTWSPIWNYEPKVPVLATDGPKVYKKTGHPESYPTEAEAFFYNFTSFVSGTQGQSSEELQ